MSSQGIETIPLYRSAEGKPKVSIIVTCYNDGEFLVEALQSLEASRPADSEVILVDDHSNDAPTLQLLAQLREQGWTVHSMPKNSGPGAARNLGARNSSGKYLLFFDADNHLLPAYFEHGVAYLENSATLGVVYGDKELFGNASGQVNLPEFHLIRLLACNYIDTCALIRRETFDSVGGFDTSDVLRGHEDWDLWLSVAGKGWQFKKLSECCFRYRVRQGSLGTAAKDPFRFHGTCKVLAEKHDLYRRHFVDVFPELGSMFSYLVLEREWNEMRNRGEEVPAPPVPAGPQTPAFGNDVKDELSGARSLLAGRRGEWQHLNITAGEEHSNPYSTRTRLPAEKAWKSVELFSKQLQRQNWESAALRAERWKRIPFLSLRKKREELWKRRRAVIFDLDCWDPEQRTQPDLPRLVCLRFVCGLSQESIVSVRVLAGGAVFIGEIKRARADVLVEVPVVLRKGKRQLVIELMGENGDWRVYRRVGVKVHRKLTSSTRKKQNHFLWSRKSGSMDWKIECDPESVSGTTNVGELKGWVVWAKQPVTAVRLVTGGRRVSVNYPQTAMKHPKGEMECGFRADIPGNGETCWNSLQVKSPSGEWFEFYDWKSLGDGEYQQWIRLYDTLLESDQEKIVKAAGNLARRPLISVVVPIFDTDEKYLRQALESVYQQLYPVWELIMVDDGSARAGTLAVMDEFAARDERVRLVTRDQRGGISLATQSGVEAARGEYIGFLDHDDLLAPHALYLVAVGINDHPQVKLFYSDEDKLNRQGHRCAPFFKPDWNPELERVFNYIGHFAVYARQSLRQAGEFRACCNGSQDWDMALRVTENLMDEEICHIPHVLYHWRMIDGSSATSGEAKPYMVEANTRALTDHLRRTGENAARMVRRNSFHYSVLRSLPDEAPEVTLIIPTRDRYDLLRPCIESVIKRTSYPKYRILVVDNGSTSHDVLDWLEEMEESGKLTVFRDDGGFNFARLNNRAVEVCETPLVCFLNNDTTVVQDDWLTPLVTQVLRPGIAAAGPKLVFPDGMIQAAGDLIGMYGAAGNLQPDPERTPYGWQVIAESTHNVTALTAACMMVRKSVFQGLGGFDEDWFAVNFNDVDFCLRAGYEGFRLVYEPQSVLQHLESASRGKDTGIAKTRRAAQEIVGLRRRWGRSGQHDPSYNPNLTNRLQDCTLAFPPRVKNPW